MHASRLFVIGSLIAGCSPAPAAVAPAPTVSAVAEEPPPGDEADDTTDGEEGGDMHVTETGLGIEELEDGSGVEAKEEDKVTVHYVGRLESGKVFDDSRKRGEPYTFRLGHGKVIAAWDEGVMGMKVGGIRRLTVPAKLGYGERGKMPDIPPNALLEFEVELMAIE